MKLKKHIKEIIITLFVISITGISYAALSTVTPSDSLTDTIWNNMVGLVNQNEANLVNISSVGVNVGIGETNPSFSLHVKSTGVSTNALFESDTSASAIGFMDSATTIRPQIVSSGNDLYFQTNGSHRMRITESGNVGIGTSTPSYKLDVAGGSMAISNISDSNTNLFFGNNGTLNWRIINRSQSGGGYLGFYNETNSAYRMAILPNGNVGIGTYVPNVALDVVGSIEYTGTIADVSDARLKENVEDINNSLEKIEQIRPVSFEMIDDENNQVEFGVIAQELEKIYPELVNTADDEMKTKSVNYVGMIAPMLGAIKELKKQNENSNNQIESLKQEIEKLKNK